MPSTIANSPRFKFFDANGNPAAYYLLHTYAAGSLTPKTTWKNQDQSTANTNPITLDANGECLLWLDESQEYKFVLTSPLGAVVFADDNIRGGSYGIAGRFSAPGGSSLVGFIQSGVGAVELTVQDKERQIVSVQDFGAIGDGATDDSAAFNAAFASGAQTVSAHGNFYIANVSIPDGIVLNAEGSTLKKAANGHIFSMGCRTQIIGGPLFDGNSGSFTGSSVVIPVGANTPTYTNQGHQLILGATFRKSESYHVAYTAPNLGWMSRLLECKFVDNPTNAPAMVLWPDETTNGGNRHIIGGYSAGPVVNVNGADNGIVQNVVIGASSINPTGQGVYFPAGTTNPAKKIIISGNRLAYGANTMTVRGIDHIITDNICAGHIELAAGTQGCSIGPNIYATTPGLIDTSAQINRIYESWSGYTPTVKSGVTVGNGTFSAEYRRDGEYVDFRLAFTLGTTSAITGAIKFNLPLPVVSGGTQVFIGAALGNAGYTGTAYIDQSSQDITIYQNGSSAAIWNASVPAAWSSGQKIIIDGRYRV